MKKDCVRVKVFDFGKDGYRAMATDGERSVWNCYGSTKQEAKENALNILRKHLKQEQSIGR